MRFKLDENLGSRGASILAAAGHDVATVFGQKMTSAADANLIAHCHAEGRCLVTCESYREEGWWLARLAVRDAWCRSGVAHRR